MYSTCTSLWQARFSAAPLSYNYPYNYPCQTIEAEQHLLTTRAARHFQLMRGWMVTILKQCPPTEASATAEMLNNLLQVSSQRLGLTN